MNLRDLAKSTSIRKKQFYSVEDLFREAKGSIDILGYFFKKESYFAIFDIEVSDFSNQCFLKEISVVKCRAINETIDFECIGPLDISSKEDKQKADELFNDLGQKNYRLLSHNLKSDLRWLNRALGDSIITANAVCSMQDINWRKYGYNSKGLEFLLFKKNLFFAAHQSLSDCLAVLALMVTHPNELSLIDSSLAQIRIKIQKTEEIEKLEQMGYEIYESTKIGVSHVEKYLLDAEISNLLHLEINRKQIKIL
jgi:hypothetical protein